MYRSGQRNTGGSCHRLPGRPPEVPNLRRNIAFYNKQLSQPPDCRTYSAEVTCFLEQQSPASSRCSAVSLAEPQLYYYIPPLMSRGFHKFFEKILWKLPHGFRPLFSFSECLYIIGMAFLRKAPVFVAPRPTRGALFSKNPTVFLRFPLIFRVLYAL